MATRGIEHPLVKTRGDSRFKTTFKQLDRPKQETPRVVGMGRSQLPSNAGIQAIRTAAGVGVGAPLDLEKIRKAENARTGLGAAIDLIRDAVNCPIWNMPTIEQTKWTFEGPIPDSCVKRYFCDEIDLFGVGKGNDCADYVETTLAQPGETQTHMLVCGVGFHICPDPRNYTVKGNAWTAPQSGEAQPPSPDVFTVNDRVNGALGSRLAGATPTEIMLPAVLEWGNWAHLVAWHMARGYNYRWRIGQHTNLIDTLLRHIAYTPASGMNGSSSSSEVDVLYDVRRTNDRYEAFGSGLVFLKQNRVRVGSIGSGGTGAALTATGPNIGVFAPSRDDELTGVTFGGNDLGHALKINQEFFRMSIPAWIKAGIPFGIFAQEADCSHAELMRAYLSITQGYQTSIPPLLTDANNINPVGDGSGLTTVSIEQTLDTTPNLVPQQVDAVRALFKMGNLDIAQVIKGFEVTDDWYTQLANNPDLRDVIMCECGCRWPG
jgi:hypothetical protein